MPYKKKTKNPKSEKGLSIQQKRKKSSIGINLAVLKIKTEVETIEVPSPDVDQKKTEPSN